jgi:alkaline phosphatase D
MLTRGNKALLIYGDIAVQDRMFHFGLHRFDYFMRDQHAAWGKLQANLPVYAAWDDHDFMNNDQPKNGSAAVCHDILKYSVRSFDNKKSSVRLAPNYPIAVACKFTGPRLWPIS